MADDQDGGIEQRNARERRKRNIALGLALLGLVILFFVMTMVRLDQIGQ